MADYQEQVIDLAVQLDRKTVVAAGVPVDAVYINQQLPAGLTVKIHAGNRPGIALSDFASVELCPAETEGIFLTTSAPAAGQTLSLILGTGIRVESGP